MYEWWPRATRPAIPATYQLIFDQNMRLPLVMEVPVDPQTAKAQMNLPISVAKTSQLRLSDTMFVKDSLSFNSPS